MYGRGLCDKGGMHSWCFQEQIYPFLTYNDLLKNSTEENSNNGDW